VPDDNGLPFRRSTYRNRLLETSVVAVVLVIGSTRCRLLVGVVAGERDCRLHGGDFGVDLASDVSALVQRARPSEPRSWRDSASGRAWLRTCGCLAKRLATTIAPAIQRNLSEYWCLLSRLYRHDTTIE